MTIQVPNPGTGNGATGDNEFVLWSKVKANFEDQTKAASRLVGEAVGNVAEIAQNAGIGGSGWGVSFPRKSWDAAKTLQQNMPTMQVRSCSAADGFSNSATLKQKTTSSNTAGTFVSLGYDTAAGYSKYLYLPYGSAKIYLGESHNPSDGRIVWYQLYTEANTTIDGNGLLKPSSPVLRVFNDHIEGNADGDTMAATYTKKGVGDYTITGTTGLRSDGWYIVIPNDMNGNPKVAVTLDDTNGVITLRSYARIFDMTTFKFVPDLEQPLDIPDGRWVDLRFEDLPIDDDALTDEV